jgi:DNA replication protein DnaC
VRALTHQYGLLTEALHCLRPTALLAYGRECAALRARFYASYNAAMMTDQTPPASYTKACEKCNEKRYVIGRAGDHARALICGACFGICPQCAGEEFTYALDERGYSFVQRCELCGTLNQRIEAFNEARIPARYYALSAAIEHFETTAKNGKAIGNLQQIKVRLHRWSTEFSPGEKGLLLHGAVGTGKTHLLAGIVRYLTLEKGIACRFIEFTHLLSEIREQFDRGRGEADILGPISQVPVLAIDELGKGRNNAWQLSIIDEIISKRYNRELTTLFTSNYPVEDAGPARLDPNAADFRQQTTQESMRERIGERIFSRLHEMATFIEIDAPDFRRR